MLVKKERRRVSGGDGGTDMNERLAAALEQLPFWPNLPEPQREMEKVLFAADELTGLIGAVALMRPSKSVDDLEVKSVKKKYKDKKFAAGCSRDVIQQGADLLGWDLNKLFEQSILAMRSCEESVRETMEKEEGKA